MPLLGVSCFQDAMEIVFVFIVCGLCNLQLNRWESGHCYSYSRARLTLHYSLKNIYSFQQSYLGFTLILVHLSSWSSMLTQSLKVKTRFSKVVPFTCYKTRRKNEMNMVGQENLSLSNSLIKNMNCHDDLCAFNSIVFK